MIEHMRSAVDDVNNNTKEAQKSDGEDGELLGLWMQGQHQP